MRSRAFVLFGSSVALGLAAVALAYQGMSRQPARPAAAAAPAVAPPTRQTLSQMIGEERRAITIRVNDVLGVGGFVLPGDRVDVLLTRSAHDTRDVPAGTDVLLQAVKVLGIDQESDERKDKPVVARAVTLEVTAEEAQRVTLGSQVGTLSLALRNLADTGSRATKTVSLSDLRPGGPPARAPSGGGGPAVRVIRGTESVEVQVVRDR